MPKAQATKEKIDKMDFIKILKTVHQRTLSRIPVKWEKVFANPVFDKDLKCRTHKELSQLNNFKMSKG